MNGHIDLGDISAATYFGGLAVVTGLLFALIDDVSGGLAAMLLHFLQWQLQTCVPMALLVIAQLCLGRCSALEGTSPWLQLGLSGLLGTLVFTPLALGLDIALVGGSERFDWPALRGEYLAVAPPVVVCWIAINVPWQTGFRLQRSGKPAPVDVDDAPLPGFYQLLVPAMRTELIYLEAELHYLAVVTTTGRSLILYNLRDAVAELPTYQGIQTHRSYWVALDHVRGLKRRDRQGEVQMSNGDSVPVSRRNLAEVDAALTS